MVISDTENQVFGDKNHTEIEIIIIRGLEDLNENVVDWLAGKLGGRAFDSNWGKRDSKDHESVNDKLTRLNKVVKKAKSENKEVFFVGVSAGATLAVAYMLRYGMDDIRGLFSISGLIYPDMHDPDPVMKEKLRILVGKKASFGEVADYVTSEFEKRAYMKAKIAEITGVYYSPNDDLVPTKAAAPDWMIKDHIHEEGNLNSHILTIGKTLARFVILNRTGDVRKVSFK